MGGARKTRPERVRRPESRTSPVWCAPSTSTPARLNSVIGERSPDAALPREARARARHEQGGLGGAADAGDEARSTRRGRAPATGPGTRCNSWLPRLYRGTGRVNVSALGFTADEAVPDDGPPALILSVASPFLFGINVLALCLKLYETVGYINLCIRIDSPGEGP